MMNQGDLPPEKTLVTETKSRIIRQNELALPKQYERKVDKAGEKDYCKSDVESCI